MKRPRPGDGTFESPSQEAVADDEPQGEEENASASTEAESDEERSDGKEEDGEEKTAIAEHGHEPVEEGVAQPEVEEAKEDGIGGDKPVH